LAATKHAEGKKWKSVGNHRPQGPTLWKSCLGSILGRVTTSLPIWGLRDVLREQGQDLASIAKVQRRGISPGVRGDSVRPSRREVPWGVILAGKRTVRNHNRLVHSSLEMRNQHEPGVFAISFQETFGCARRVEDSKLRTIVASLGHEEIKN